MKYKKYIERKHDAETKFNATTIQFRINNAVHR